MLNNNEEQLENADVFIQPGSEQKLKGSVCLENYWDASNTGETEKKEENETHLSNAQEVMLTQSGTYDPFGLDDIDNTLQVKMWNQFLDLKR